jgi:ribulose-5-phosphate 4-epimerase/fuculose-1-phosphate aldolase
MLSTLGLASGVLASLGHASMRIPSQPDRFVVKGRGYEVDALAAMRPEHMVLCDLNGYKIDGPVGVTQCGEVQMHSCIYRARPDVQSIVHVHPRFTIIMSILAKRLVPMCNEGNELVLDPLPIFPHSRLILSEPDREKVANILGMKKAIVLRGHGAATIGGSLEEAILTMLFLEEQARMNWYGYCAAGRNHPQIPDSDTEEWIANYKTSKDLPHFKQLIEQIGGVPRRNGIWNYYSTQVAEQIRHESIPRSRVE